MSKEELLSKIRKIDDNIRSLLDPLEMSSLVVERGKLIALISESNLSEDESSKLLEANEKIVFHLKRIELDLERRGKDLLYSSKLLKNYYNLSRTKGTLLSGKI